MAEQPVNLPTAIYLGVFSRAEQRVLQAIFKAIAEGGGKCVATLAMLARDSHTSKPTARNAIAQAVAIGLLENTKRRSVSLPNILSYGERLMAPHGADVGVYVRGALSGFACRRKATHGLKTIFPTRLGRPLKEALALGARPAWPV